MLPELVELRLMFVFTLLELPVLLSPLVELLVRLDAEPSVLKRLELSLIAIFCCYSALSGMLSTVSTGRSKSDQT
jgi:hypothetical protein